MHRDQQLTPELIQAAHKSDVERIRDLVDSGHSLKGTCEEGGDLLFHFIWRCCDADKVGQLLAMGCKPENKSSRDGTPMVAAVWCKCPRIVDMLLKEGADPNIIAFLKDDEASALDAVIADYCDCDTVEETDHMIEIERMIRTAGGRAHTSDSRSGYFPDWQYPD